MGAATAFAEKPQGCKVLGSWMGYDNVGDANWISMVMGQSSSKGTYILEAPGFDATLGGLYQDAVMGGTLRGVWKRTGPNTFAVTLIGLAVDSGGNTLYISKLSATDTFLAEDCNSMWIEGTLELFLPNQNPFDEEPFIGPFPLDPHWGYRMSVDPLDNP
jgi:hypothetical protein